MRFNSISISNLRAIERFEVDDLKDFIVIAGQNGSGKSSVFDGLRLLKSVYGGYQADEYMQWFGEFAINLQDKSALRRLFRDSSREIKIAAEVSFTEAERAFVLDNLDNLTDPIAWQMVTGQRSDHWSFSRMAIALQLQQYEEQVKAASASLKEAVRSQFTSRDQSLSLTILPSGEMYLNNSKPVEVAFQSYQPDHLGVIEYHSASRAYTRQDVGGIDLNVRNFQDQRRQQALYNWQAKYQNVKTELASSYLRQLISRQAGTGGSEDDLNATLAELFKTFFPDKSYGGVRPLENGGLEFPVKVGESAQHDIDDLSSGEKEILYGYLRLRNSTPANSVILLDEPELHLNPSLMQGYADFYHRHLGLARGNQLWLVTHSDALLRQAVGNSNYRVYHMVSASSAGPAVNQAAEVLLDDELDRAAIDLVGDLASYRPQAKIVILEGAEDDGFDVGVVRRLFPDAARRLNLVSGGSKRRVRDLHEILVKSSELNGAHNKFYAICDRDSDVRLTAEIENRVFTWDRYHIENYLLDSELILSVSTSLSSSAPFATVEEVDAALVKAAREVLGGLVVQVVQRGINSALIKTVSIGIDPASRTPAADFLNSVASSTNKFRAAADGLTYEEVNRRVTDAQAKFADALSDASWRTEFPGRDVLKRFVGASLVGVNYVAFRNLLLDKMAEQQIQPVGMKAVIERVLHE
ncbi:AAA family ATPase [Klenkia taihuensis]|uniref:AAA domain-containing protein n=1 Tax=Klenkia taihuensis TaxID=1225127 RepID=A0A1I1TGK9_9ACTN|nr:AAA family ATPase [Klenkia taihuensis]SFD57726.1 AAA domain-containing protein [Klenkia taihuensis]